MFKQNKTLNSSKVELANFIEEQDIFNSLLMEKMNVPGLVRVLHKVSSNYRPDLVAKDFYGSAEYMGILLLQVNPSLTEFKKGNELRLLPKETIDNIITGLL